MVLYVVASKIKFPTNENTKDKLTITNLNVGKADCAVIRYKELTGIIDAGEYEDYGYIDSFLKNSGSGKIDFLILTHYDQDHIGSAMAIIENYDIDNIFLPDYVSDKKYYKDLTESVSDHKGVKYIKDETAISFDEIQLTIIPATDPEALLEDENNKDNDMSLICLLNYGAKKFLFTGDIEKARMEQILDSGSDLQADWVKLPHHGAYEKKIKKFIESVSPTYAVISTSAEQEPEEKLTDILDDKKIRYFSTMYSDVVTVCDGLGIKVYNNK
ncbi:MAG: MBL fold metallo-hydrolase [Butyrivibrio sp.]|nr:MBL fold metallo-hydrolase [Butyrivibrio sp.]